MSGHDCDELICGNVGSKNAYCGDFGRANGCIDFHLVVNSPVEASVNGNSAQVFYAGGYPGATDVYQVNLQLPSGIQPGMASLQVTSAWQPSAPVQIPIRSAGH